ncbi:ABC transporter ATP-binding protein [Paenibacillus flagellatus]|uniref:Peptide ABC transporter ATP-binding protein n=1 Tax=Paenibacillus flagellatus TaxID=2211139 RepID=A0A2V5KL33_9BACL|nr:ABC transporter ATP-binding protein [Paenibacillus flagellatus]PYI55620.1 peptide ABC transporter ATP-binding protein [Paenibacillus flagellatus]
MARPVLEVSGLSTSFFTDNGVVPSVDGVSFDLREGETLGIVGESGSGKSVTTLSIMGLIEPPGRIVQGEIRFRGENLLQLDAERMRRIRGRDIAMIFQEPLTALNPVFRIGRQIEEMLLTHTAMSKEEAKRETLSLLKKVMIPRPESVYEAYPHELSGGMRQRAMIAMAIACKPSVLIADEPTTALDVSIQAQVIRLMKDLIRSEGGSILLITHDLGVVAELADRVAVMYAGQIVEQCDVFTLFRSPKHPYTQGLLKSTPQLFGQPDTLESIDGSVPNPLFLPPGCRFHPRCAYATDDCRTKRPELNEIGPGHLARCLLAEREAAAAGS